MKAKRLFGSSGKDGQLHFGIVPFTHDHDEVVKAAYAGKVFCRTEKEGNVLVTAWQHERNVVENSSMAYRDQMCSTCMREARKAFPLPKRLEFPEGLAIKFYRANEPVWGAFSNLYRRPITFEGETFASAEFAYQAAKPRDPKVKEWLMAAPTNALLAKTAHQLTTAWEVAPGWSAGKVDRMRRILHAKFTQHEDLKQLLLATGDIPLVEAGTIDDQAGRFWGIVHDAKGREKGGNNQLGKLLMELREQLLIQTVTA